MEYILNINKNIKDVDSASIEETLKSIDNVYVKKIDSTRYYLSIARYSALTKIREQDFFGYAVKIRDEFIDPI